jgi:hypothetical protein
MRNLIPIFICAVVCAEDVPQGKTEVERFEATVTAVTFFNRFAGSVAVLHSDPKFVITLKKEDDGDSKNYAIHSIAQLFGDEDMKSLAGKKFRFVRTRIFDAGGKVVNTKLAVERGVGGEK